MGESGEVYGNARGVTSFSYRSACCRTQSSHSRFSKLPISVRRLASSRLLIAPKLKATEVNAETANATPTPETPVVMLSTISEYPVLRVFRTAFMSAGKDTPVCV